MNFKVVRIPVRDFNHHSVVQVIDDVQTLAALILVVLLITGICKAESKKRYLHGTYYGLAVWLVTTQRPAEMPSSLNSSDLALLSNELNVSSSSVYRKKSGSLNVQVRVLGARRRSRSGW